MSATQYCLGIKIGSGGLADVFEATDDRGRTWAIKRLKQDITDDKLVARFRQESRIQATLQHQSIMPVIAANTSADQPYYVMLRADSNLEDKIQFYSKNHEALIPIARQLISAIEYAHGQRVLHRDLKPKNVLLLDETVALADFGLGKALDIAASYHTTTSDSWGTYWYAPPEQERGLTHCDERSDIFSLGKLFLECLAGRRANEIPDSVDQRWQYIIRRCIKDTPGERWQTASDLRRQFDLVFDLGAPQVIDPEDVLGQLATIASQRDAISSKQLEHFQHLAVRITDDDVLLRRVVDRLPPNLVAAWCDDSPDSFETFIRAYDDSLGEMLTFEYCDTVADQYAMFHSIAQDPEFRQFLRERLFRLGPSHNRWHVGRALESMLCTVREPADIAHVLELIETKPELVDWNRKYIKSVQVDQRIRDAMKS